MVGVVARVPELLRVRRDDESPGSLDRIEKLVTLLAAVVIERAVADLKAVAPGC